MMPSFLATAVGQWFACLVAALSLIAFARQAPAADFFWTDPAGGSFRDASNWQTSPPTAAVGPGGPADVVHFNLNASPAAPYTVTDVFGQNDRLLVHTDSLVLEIDAYLLEGTSQITRSFTVGESAGDHADLLLTRGESFQAFRTGHSTIGASPGSSGNLTVDGLLWESDGAVSIGSGGSGTLTVQSGAVLASTGGMLGESSSGTGAVTVRGHGSMWTNSGPTIISESGTGTLSIEAGGKVLQSFATLATHHSSAGEVVVTGEGSGWISSTSLFIGESGVGTLTVSDGGSVSSSSGTLGLEGTASGTVTLMGAGSHWDNSGSLTVGSIGKGSMSIEDGASVSSAIAQIGEGIDSMGSVTVLGAEAVWTNREELIVGRFGAGSLTIVNGGSVSNTAARLGHDFGSKGDVAIAGAGASWTSSGELTVGLFGEGRLRVLDGGTISSVGASIGTSHSSVGSVIVRDAGSAWINSSDVAIGQFGEGTLSIRSGGRVENGPASIGTGIDTTGRVVVDQIGSIWLTRGTLTVGASAAGELTINDGASVSNMSAVIGLDAGATGSVTVDGAFPGGTVSTWTNAGDLTIGSFGTGLLTIRGGAQVTSLEGRIAAAPGSAGFVTVRDPGSSWVSSNLFVGSGNDAVGGNGMLTVTNGAVVDVAGTTRIAPRGTMNLDGGTLRTAQLDLAGGPFNWITGTLNLTGPNGLAIGTGGLFGSSVLLHPDQRLEIDHVLAVEANATLLAGGGLGAGSAVVMSGGRLIVDGGLQAEAAQIAPGGQLWLNGAAQQFGTGLTNHGHLIFSSATVVTGQVTNAAGASITALGDVKFDGLVDGPGDFYGPGSVTFAGGVSPGSSPAEVTFEANVEFESGNVLFMELGGLQAGDQHDHLMVRGNLALDGTLDVQLIGGFVPTAGDAFELFDFGTLGGQFAQLSLPSLGGGLRWDTSNLYMSGVLGVVPEPGTIVLAALGLLGLLRDTRRRR